MQKITIKLAILFAVFIFVIMPASATDVNYNQRSSVYDNTDPAISEGDFYWDANTFSGFWYQLPPGLSSEIIYFNNNVNNSSTFQLGDKIAGGDLYYVCKPQMKMTKIGSSYNLDNYTVNGVDLKKYYLVGFFGSSYVVAPQDPSIPSVGCNPNKIAKILMEQTKNDEKQMFSGDEWELAGGWTLVVKQIDVEGNKVWLELKKNGEILDSTIVSTAPDMTRPQKTYIYKDNDNFPIFYCNIDSIFKGADSDFVTIKYASLRDNITIIENGDSYGLFDVTSFEIPTFMNGTNYAGTGSGTILNTGDSALVLSNNEEIILNPDTLIDLYGEMYIQTAGTCGSSLKMTLHKKVHDYNSRSSIRGRNY
ncbi:hypothetical protein HNV12_07750 [Methanococcoides sp. SA1]|nr:hypothetical protein [Methanococcoides sp. SA1]